MAANLSPAGLSPSPPLKNGGEGRGEVGLIYSDSGHCQEACPSQSRGTRHCPQSITMIWQQPVARRVFSPPLVNGERIPRYRISRLDPLNPKGKRKRFMERAGVESRQPPRAIPPHAPRRNARTTTGVGTARPHIAPSRPPPTPTFLKPVTPKPSFPSFASVKCFSLACKTRLSKS